jgi:hypothetical protein
MMNHSGRPGCAFMNAATPPRLQDHLTELWKECPKGNALSVGVWLFNLIPDELHTLSLFDSEEKRYKASMVMDQINPALWKKHHLSWQCA